VRDAPDKPRATYRLQLTPDFGFARARELVPYLRDLGISHLYLSPSLQAREGSTHGYDIVDHRQINPERGGEPALRRRLIEVSTAIVAEAFESGSPA